MKKSIPYLFPMEYEMMMIFWNHEKPLTVAEVLENRKEGTWAKNSVHPLLKNLLHKGFLVVVGTQKSGKVNSRLYTPNISMEEYMASQVSEVFEDKKSNFDIGCFMAGLLGEDPVSDKKIISNLEDWIKNQQKSLADYDN